MGITGKEKLGIPRAQRVYSLHLSLSVHPLWRSSSMSHPRGCTESSASLPPHMGSLFSAAEGVCVSPWEGCCLWSLLRGSCPNFLIWITFYMFQSLVQAHKSGWHGPRAILGFASRCGEAECNVGSRGLVQFLAVPQPSGMILGKTFNC